MSIERWGRSGGSSGSILRRRPPLEARRRRDDRGGETMSQILLVSGASVAIHKACDLASKLTQDGHKVRAILTRSAAKLVSPQLFEALSGEPAYTDEFGEGRKGAMDHIDLARWGECLVVAPCTADLLARLALGLSD